MTYAFPDLCIVCEGERDRAILAVLVDRLLRLNSISRRVEILVANGKVVVPRLVQAAEARFSPDSLVVVVDSDGRPRAVRKMLERSFRGREHWIVIAHPNVESWVTAGRFRNFHSDDLQNAATRANLTWIETQHPEFRLLREALTSFPLPQ